MSAFERLKQSLLSEERALLDEHARRFKALPHDLPYLIDQARALDSSGRLASALAEPVAQALASAVRHKRRAIVDALFPVIGPAIRLAIAASLRGLMDDLSRALESGLTLRGVRWRLEAWRAGVPYAQVVLKHTLRFKLDHLFLIKRNSGLVIDRKFAPDLPELDPHAIAGMLTAIGDFVRDSVSRDSGGTLSAAHVGEHVLWVFEGPRANLACFIRGVPPDALRVRLESLLEDLHANFDDRATSGGAMDHAGLLDDRFDLLRLEASVREKDHAALPTVWRWPLWIAFILVVLVAVAWPVRSWLWERHIQEARDLLHNWPGFVLEDLQSIPYRSVELRGLLDPLADPPQEALVHGPFRAVTVESHFRGYLSTDSEILVRRATRALEPPPSVSLQAADSVLTLRGVASPEWIATARARALAVPGVITVDVDALTPDPIGAARAALEALAERVSAHKIQLASGHAVPETEEERVAVAELVSLLQEAESRAAAARARLRVLCFGLTDTPGSDLINVALRERRASWLVSEIEHRIPGLDIEIASLDAMESESLRSDERAMRVELTIVATTP